MSGNNAFIKKLQKERTNYNHASQVRTLAKSIMQLSVGIYTEPERFVYELLQNAVDAFSDTAGDALEVLITVEGDKFMFMHNGKKFSEKDVEGISDVGNGDKANDSKKIGYKGIGFKSVFLPSVENVTILSGDFCFEFDKKKACSLMRRVLWKEKPLEEDEVPWQVIPIEVPEMANFNTQGFSVVTIVRTSEAQKIASKIEKLFSDLQFLLFLPSKNVNIRFENAGQVVFSVGKRLKTNTQDGISTVELLRNNVPQSSWMLKSETVSVPSDVKLAIVRDFNTPDKLKGAESLIISFAVCLDGDKIVPIKDAAVFTFLPTSYRRLKEPFLVNANFITDAGRQQLHQENEWNKLIFSKIPGLYLKFVSLFSKNYSNYTDVLPERFPENDTLTSVYRGCLEVALDSTAFVPNGNGNKLLKLSEVFKDNTGISSGIIKPREFLSHVNRRHEKRFTVDNFVDDNGIIKYAHDKVCVFETKDIIRLISDGDVMNSLSSSDDASLIKFLCQYSSDTSKMDGIDRSSFIDELSHVAFIMDENGEIDSANNLFFPSDFRDQNTQTSDVVFVNSDVYNLIRQDSIVIDWLKALGVRELSNASFVDYLLAHPDYITTSNALEIGTFLFNAWKEDNFIDRDNNAKEIKELNFLTKSGRLAPICNLFLGSQYKPEDDLELVISDDDIFISDDYANPRQVEDWAFFLKKCGVGYKIGISEKIVDAQYSGYSFLTNAAQAFSGRRHNYTGYWGYQNPIIRIKAKLNYFSFVNPSQPNKKIDQFVFKKVLAGDRNKWSTIDEISGIIKYWGEYRGARPIVDPLMAHVPHSFKSQYHSYLEYAIAKEQKFPTTEGTFEKADCIYINSSSNLELCGKYLPVLDIDCTIHESWRELLPFKTSVSTNDLLEVLSRISEDTESDKDSKKERISRIYREIIERGQQNSPEVVQWGESHTLLSQSGDFMEPEDLTYVTVDGFKGTNKVYCEKVGKDNRDGLIQLLKSFGVRVITQEDIAPTFIGAELHDDFKEKLISKSQYIALLKKDAASAFNKSRSELENKLLAAQFFKCEEISLTYGEQNDKINKNTFFKDGKFYHIGNLSLARIEPLLTPLCKYLNIAGSESELLVILMTNTHADLVNFLSDKGYDTKVLVAPVVPAPVSITEETGAIVPTGGVTMSAGLEGGISTEAQITVNEEAKRFVKQKLEDLGYTFTQGIGTQSTINGVVKNGVEYPLVVKSYKYDREPIKIGANEWIQLMKEHAVLLIYRGGNNLGWIDIRGLLLRQDMINLQFSTLNIEKGRLNEFAQILHYFNDIHFDFNSINPFRFATDSLDDCRFKAERRKETDIEDDDTSNLD